MKKYLEFHNCTKIFNDIPFDSRKYNILVEPKKYRFSKKIKLKNSPLKVDIIKVLRNRETIRDMNNSFIDKQKVFNIIYYSIFNRKKRAYPSAGARYPIELYFISFNVENVEKGIYYINQEDKNIYLIKEGDFKNELYTMSQKQNFVEKSSFAIIMTANFERTISKYGERGYRYIFLDAGHIGQNFSLVSYGQHVNCIPVGGFLDDDINRILNLSKEEQVVYLMYFGK